MIKPTLLAKLVEKKLITANTQVMADIKRMTPEGVLAKRTREVFQVLNVTSSPLFSEMTLDVVNVDDGARMQILSYDIVAIDGLTPTRFAVSKGLPPDGIERTVKRRGRKPKNREVLADLDDEDGEEGESLIEMEVPAFVEEDQE